MVRSLLWMPNAVTCSSANLRVPRPRAVALSLFLCSPAMVLRCALIIVNYVIIIIELKTKIFVPIATRRHGQSLEDCTITR